MKKRIMLIVFATVMCCVMLNGCSGDKTDQDFENSTEEQDGFEGVFEIQDKDGNVLVDTDDLKSIDTVTHENGNKTTYGVDIELSEYGAGVFYNATMADVGYQFPVYVNGVCVSKPTIQEAIQDGKIEINGFASLSDAYEIVSAVKNGTEIEGIEDTQTTERTTQEPERTDTTRETETTTAPQEETTQEDPADAMEYDIKSAVRRAVGSSNTEEISYNADTEYVLIKIKGAENVSSKLTVESMLKNIYDILEELDDIEPLSVDINVIYPMIDEYGSTKDETVIKASYSNDTRSKLDFDGLVWTNIGDAADDWWMHPSCESALDD